MTNKSNRIVKEVLINAPVAKVWQAISDKNEMKHWYFDLAEFRPEVGFEFQFEGGPDDRVYVHLCKVTEVVPEQKLSYSWRYKGYPGDSLVTFELFPEGDKTRVKLIHTGVESFGDNPDLARENFDAGWTDLIQKLLKEYLEKNA